MGYEVWDVAHVPAYPNQEDQKEFTARPVIIIEDLQDEVAICPVTKQLHQAGNYTYAFVVTKDSPEGRQMGLTFDSLIVLDRIVQLKKIRLVGIIGSCPESVIEKIEELIRKMKEDGMLA